MSGEIEARIDALRVEIQRERDEIDVAGAFAIAEQAALDAVGAREQREFGRRDRGAAIVVRMHRQHDAVAVREVASIHSIWSANTFGLASTVAGRLTIIL